MSIGLTVGNRYWSIGTPDFFGAFFDTVAVRLEAGVRGSQFPLLARDLYSGRLDPSGARDALLEVERIRAGLAAHPPEDVVWDADERDRRPPWGDRISPDITDLSTYFVTDDGADLLDVLAEALTESLRQDEPLVIG